MFFGRLRFSVLVIQVGWFPGTNLPQRLKTYRRVRHWRWRILWDTEQGERPASARTAVSGSPSNSSAEPKTDDLPIENKVRASASRIFSIQATQKSTQFKSIKQKLSTFFTLPQSTEPSTPSTPISARVPGFGPKKARDKLPSKWHFTWQGFGWLVGYIVASELQLSWNHLDGINDVDIVNMGGQIIPLAIGALSLLRAFYILGLDLWEGWRGRGQVGEERMAQGVED
jgi:hypothetical protein